MSGKRAKYSAHLEELLGGSRDEVREIGQWHERILEGAVRGGRDC